MKLSVKLLLLTIPIIILIACVWWYQNYQKEQLEIEAIKERKVLPERYKERRITKEWTDTGGFIGIDYDPRLYSEEPFELNLDGVIYKSEMVTGSFMIWKRIIMTDFPDIFMKNSYNRIVNH